VELSLSSDPPWHPTPLMVPTGDAPHRDDLPLPLFAQVSLSLPPPAPLPSMFPSGGRRHSQRHVLARPFSPLLHSLRKKSPRLTRLAHPPFFLDLFLMFLCPFFSPSPSGPQWTQPAIHGCGVCSTFLTFCRSRLELLPPSSRVPAFYSLVGFFPLPGDGFSPAWTPPMYSVT